MRFVSTGLGKTELYANLVNIEIEEDLLIMHFDTYQPVQWHLRTALQAQDRLDLIIMILKLNFRLFPYLFNWRSKTPPREPESIFEDTCPEAGVILRTWTLVWSFFTKFGKKREEEKNGRCKI